MAHKSPHILVDPEPIVIFDAFGDSSLNFELAVWTLSHIDKPRILKSELYFEIFKKFKEKGIEIPFPQGVIHIKSSEPEKLINK